MAFGIIIIGDEILSGRRSDKHLAKIIELLGERGLSLGWAEYIGDDPQRITATLKRSLCGGIGATPDDHTRQAAAAALGRPLALHPEAAALIARRTTEMAAEGRGSADMSLPENRQRLKMGEFPEGSAIIPNPYNRIPGFTIDNHCFVPGFPVMAWPMIESVLDSQFAHLHHRDPRGERSLLLHGVAEATATPLMEAIEAEFPNVKVFSLPSAGDANRRRHIELGVKGEPSQVAAAYARMLAGLDELKQEYVPN